MITDVNGVCLKCLDKFDQECDCKPSKKKDKAKKVTKEDKTAYSTKSEDFNLND